MTYQVTIRYSNTIISEKFFTDLNEANRFAEFYETTLPGSRAGYVVIKDGD